MKAIFISSVSACIEKDDFTPYFSNEKYDVYLNGELIYEQKQENVFSLFNLTPNTEYSVSVLGKTLTFTTDSVTKEINAKDFGAVGDGKADDTKSLQTAIDNCEKGGMVTVPKGEYKTVNLMLKSDITLNLLQGARLIGETNPEKYPIMPDQIVDDFGKEKVVSVWEGAVMKSYASLIGGYSVNNVKIVGQGVIDGNAQNGPWWQDQYVCSREVARPRVVFLNDCKNIGFHGVTIENGAAWNVHPFFSENVGFYNVKVNAPKRSPNTDGINPEGCDKVDIIGCVISTGDDCIAIKSGTRALAEKYKRSADNYTIRNCLMNDGHGAVVIGSEMSGGVKNLAVNKCLFLGTERGLRIKTRRNRGKLAVVDGIEFSNIKMQGVLTPLVMNMFYNCGIDGQEEYVWSREVYPIDDSTPYLGSFTFKDIDCEGVEVCAGWFDGLPERPIEKVEIENMNFTFKDGEKQKKMPALANGVKSVSGLGLYFNNVKKVVLNKVKVIGAEGEDYIFSNCQEKQIF